MELPPYAAVLGIRICEGETVLVMPFGDHVAGRPGFVQGGAIAGLLEIAALRALRAALGEVDQVRVKPIGITVDYMRGGRMLDTFAEGRVMRVGKRIANVDAEAWQQDRTALIATARMNLLLVHA